MPKYWGKQVGQKQKTEKKIEKEINNPKTGVAQAAVTKRWP